jgi:hypothetical protein
LPKPFAEAANFTERGPMTLKPQTKMKERRRAAFSGVDGFHNYRSIVLCQPPQGSEHHARKSFVVVNVLNVAIAKQVSTLTHH